LLAELPLEAGNPESESPKDRLPDPNGEITECLGTVVEEFRHLEDAGEKIKERQLSLALGRRMKNGVVDRQLAVPGWDPQPGNVDVWARDHEDRPRLVVEAKLKSTNDIYECLWDMAKVASLTTLASVEAGYIVAGTTKHNWQKPIECADMFEDGRHDLVGTIKRLESWWIKYILGDSTGRSRAVPGHVDITRIASAFPEINGQPWEIRAIRVTPVPEDPAQWAPFEDGRPAT